MLVQSPIGEKSSSIVPGPAEKTAPREHRFAPWLRLVTVTWIGENTLLRSGCAGMSIENAKCRRRFHPRCRLLARALGKKVADTADLGGIDFDQIAITDRATNCTVTRRLSESPGFSVPRSQTTSLPT